MKKQLQKNMKIVNFTYPLPSALLIPINPLERIISTVQKLSAFEGRIPARPLSAPMGQINLSFNEYCVYHVKG